VGAPTVTREAWMADFVLLSPADAAESILGWKGKFRGKKLIRKVKSKEKRIGRQIAKRKPGRNGVEQYQLTEDILRKEMPELFEISGISLAKEIRSHVDAMDASLCSKIDEAVSERASAFISANLSTRVDMRRLETELRARCDTLESRIVDLSRKIGR